MDDIEMKKQREIARINRYRAQSLKKVFAFDHHSQNNSGTSENAGSSDVDGSIIIHGEDTATTTRAEAVAVELTRTEQGLYDQRGV